MKAIDLKWLPIGATASELTEAGVELTRLLHAAEHGAVVGPHQALPRQLIELGQVAGIQVFAPGHPRDFQREIPALRRAR